MRSALPLLLAAALPLTAEETVDPPRDESWELVWSDEFDRDGPPDPDNWNFEHGFERNEELQWYQPDNAFCKDGLLVIEARRETVPNPRHDPDSRSWKLRRESAAYTSSSLTSADKREFTFGRFEIRARFPALPGLWPAIWTTGRGGWPHGGEIDLMEYYNHGILANFCWAGEGGRSVWDDSFHPMADFDEQAWDDEFHLWVMEWDEKAITIHLDGKLLNTLEMDHVRNADGPAINPFLHPQYLRLNLAIGGQRGGDPSATDFPQRYEIDYVRVYRQRDPAE